MDVRAQISMVFHLDKCIGCHTCSLACKNIWTDRKGAEYMWWNNVETKPGAGYPTLWEDQEKYKGGWEKDGDRMRLRLQGRLGGLSNIFFNPYLPTIDEYYEPWTYRYEDLFTAPEGDDQPTARPISAITGKPIDIEAGPNWDDDLGGSPLYACHDPNLAGLSDTERRQLNALERIVFFYLPRICNHCLNPGCVGACPAGAIYKRGEDGIVLISQDKCRAWRMCISGCPYKKVYFNWAAGKSEKCILCYPRLESGHAQACFHACVGRIRYVGALLYDADRIGELGRVADADLVDAQHAMILDPFDAEVVAAAKRSGVADAMIDSARESPVYRLVKQWGLALPLHPEFRTLPMLFYVPPLLPVLATVKDGQYDAAGAGATRPAPSFTALEDARVPLRFMANLLAAGDEERVAAVYRKLIAIRVHRRAAEVGDVPAAEVEQALAAANLTAGQAEAIFHLSATATFDERFVIPPLARETAIEPTRNPYIERSETGFGYRQPPRRRW